jgi:hypothetical protein
MKCKFCGCSDRKACAIPMTFGDHPLDTDVPINCLPGELAEFTTPCHWIAPDVCSAPPCVERAYEECCAFIDQLIAGELIA